MRGLASRPALEVVQHLPCRRSCRIGQCAALRRRDDLARPGQNHEGRIVGGLALVVRALRARRGVRAKGECQEGGQREPLHTGVHGPTGIWEVYTARALQGFECCFREREGDRVPGLEDRDELGRHTPGYFPRKSRRNPTVSIVPWAMTDTQRLRPVTKYKSPNTKPPNPAVIMPESP